MYTARMDIDVIFHVRDARMSTAVIQTCMFANILYEVLLFGHKTILDVEICTCVEAEVYRNKTNPAYPMICTSVFPWIPYGCHPMHDMVFMYDIACLCSRRVSVVH